MVVPAGNTLQPIALVFPLTFSSAQPSSPTALVIRLLIHAPRTLCANLCLTIYHMILQFHVHVYLSPLPDGMLPEGKNCLMRPLSQTLTLTLF